MSRKIIFVIVSLILILSIGLPYAMPYLEDLQTDVEETADTLEERKQKSEKTAEQKGLEGTVRKLEASIYQQGTHYLEADGITLALLESSSGINLDRYIGRNIVVYGTPRQTVEGDGVIIDVERVISPNVER
ncbi:hypothetical protein HYV44_03870 [Candidatus Microgenomates bacterium]|nr:hypothetical protein [Candidatus Microgenomates bacterium]